MATGADKRKMAGRLGAQSLRAFLPASFMKDMRQQEAENTQLCVLWERQVNAPLVNHVRPIHYEKKTLHVNADSPAWASRARYQAREMVVRLRREKYFQGHHPYRGEGKTQGWAGPGNVTQHGAAARHPTPAGQADPGQCHQTY